MLNQFWHKRKDRKWTINSHKFSVQIQKGLLSVFTYQMPLNWMDLLSMTSKIGKICWTILFIFSIKILNSYLFLRSDESITVVYDFFSLRFFSFFFFIFYFTSKRMETFYTIISMAVYPKINSNKFQKNFSISRFIIPVLIDYDPRCWCDNIFTLKNYFNLRIDNVRAFVYC